MKTMIALAMVLAITTAQAQGAAGETAAPPGTTMIDTLTVEDAMNVLSGLQQLVAVETVDKDGKQTKTYYKFSAKTRIDIAVNIDAGRRVQGHFQEARNAIVMQMSNGSGLVGDDKISLLNFEASKLVKEKARAQFIKIKMTDLKLDENDIPGPVLSLFLPIIDR